jgi:putative phosphoribosyl transferase
MLEVEFKNRKEAGKFLAHKLAQQTFSNPLIFALPRGGVPVAEHVAHSIAAPLDTLVVQTISVPQNPNVILGALAQGDIMHINQYVKDSFDISDKELEELIAHAQHELLAKIVRYKSGLHSTSINQHSEIIIIDDGRIAAISAQTAIEAVRKLYSPRRVIFATPICTRDNSKAISTYADELIYVYEIDDLIALDLWYEHLESLTDEDVLKHIHR